MSPSTRRRRPYRKLEHPIFHSQRVAFFLSNAASLGGLSQHFLRDFHAPKKSIVFSSHSSVTKITSIVPGSSYDLTSLDIDNSRQVGIDNATMFEIIIPAQKRKLVLTRNTKRNVESPSTKCIIRLTRTIVCNLSYDFHI
jgi:hypothetical protein